MTLLAPDKAKIRSYILAVKALILSQSSLLAKSDSLSPKAITDFDFFAFFFEFFPDLPGAKS